MDENSEHKIYCKQMGVNLQKGETDIQAESCILESVQIQLDAIFSQVYYLTFRCGSKCFGRLRVHHQELTTALTASGFTVGARW